MFPIALEKYLWATWSTELSKYIQYTYNEVLIYATTFSKHYTFMGMCIYMLPYLQEKNHLTKCKKHSLFLAPGYWQYHPKYRWCAPTQPFSVEAGH